MAKRRFENPVSCLKKMTMKTICYKKNQKKNVCTCGDDGFSLQYVLFDFRIFSKRMSSRQKIEENTTGRKCVAFFRIRANFVSLRFPEDLWCHPAQGFTAYFSGQIGILGEFTEAKIRPFHNNWPRQRYEDVFRFDFTIDESLGMDVFKSPGQLVKNLYI